LDKSWRTASLTDAKYQILFVDEARGISVVMLTVSGVYRHNNVSFNDVKCMSFIKWNFGKISKMNSVEMNPEKSYSLFLTKADKQFNKFLYTMYNNEGNVKEIGNYIADDIVISFDNIYPLSILMQGGKNATFTDKGVKEGQDVRLSVKGKDNAIKLAQFCNQFVFNLTSSIKVLYSNENTVVAAKIFRPASLHYFPLNQKMFWKTVTILYTINRFNDQGMLKQVNMVLNRPLAPFHLRQVNQMLNENGDQPLSTLLNPLLSIIQIDAR